MKGTLHQNIKDVLGLSPAVRGANTYDSAIIDTAGFDELSVKLLIGTMTATGTARVKLQHADVNASDSMADTDPLIQGPLFNEAVVDKSDTLQLINVDLRNVKGLKRFVRARLTTAEANVACALMFSLGGQKYLPVQQAEAVHSV